MSKGLNMKNKQFNLYSKFTKSVNEDKGYVDIEGWASKAYENGKPIVDRDGEHVLASSLELTDCKVLLAQHDWDRVLGTVQLSHKPEGIWLKGRVFEKMDEKTYFAVKNGILDSFSIGFTIREAEYITVDGQDILQLKNGAVHEVSIVSIPANTKATMSSVKSIIKDGKCIGLECSIEDIKAANPNMECGCNKEKGKEVKDIKETIKGLTFEDTMQDSWNEKQRLNYYIDILAETISDNWYESMWSDGISGEDAKTNILTAIEAFKSKLEEFTTLQTSSVVNPNVTKSLETPVEVKIDEVVAEVVEAIEEPLEGKIEEQSSTPVEVQTPEQVELKEELAEDIGDEPKEETPAEEIVEEQPKEVVAKDVLDSFGKLDLAKLSAEEIKEIYETVTDRIEEYVAQEIKTQGDVA